MSFARQRWDKLVEIIAEDELLWAQSVFSPTRHPFCSFDSWQGDNVLELHAKGTMVNSLCRILDIKHRVSHLREWISAPSTAGVLNHELTARCNLANIVQRHTFDLNDRHASDRTHDDNIRRSGRASGETGFAQNCGRFFFSRLNHGSKYGAMGVIGCILPTKHLTCCLLNDAGKFFQFHCVIRDNPGAEQWL